MFKKTLEIRFRGDLTEARTRAPREASSMQQDSCGISVCLGLLRKSEARPGRDEVRELGGSCSSSGHSKSSSPSDMGSCGEETCGRVLRKEHIQGAPWGNNCDNLVAGSSCFLQVSSFGSEALFLITLSGGLLFPGISVR